jgi:hypothetical protein
MNFIASKYFTVAVHPNTYIPNNLTAVSSEPVIPYGSTIITDNQITMPGDPAGSEDTFYVEDLGDLNNTRGLTDIGLIFIMVQMMVVNIL